MEAVAGYSARRLVEYDALRRRLWIFGQRCHHGATGSVVAAAAFVALLTDPMPLWAYRRSRPVLALAAAGGALMMAHDWKDRSIWFERGRAPSSRVSISPLVAPLAVNGASVLHGPSFSPVACVGDASGEKLGRSGVVA